MHLLLMLVISSGIASAAPNASAPALEAAKDLVGVYTGHWMQYGPDGKVSLEWDDRIEAFHPRVEDGRAVVTAVDTMEFTFPKKFTVREVFTEGYFINMENGSAGLRFFEYQNGMMMEEHEAGKNTWTIRSPVDLSSYASLGITKENSIFASNLAVKTSTFEGEKEVQNVTFTTTLVWKNAEGQIVSKQFVSLTGVHERSYPAR